MITCDACRANLDGGQDFISHWDEILKCYVYFCNETCEYRFYRVTWGGTGNDPEL
jgi:hypothetical protein